MFVMFSLFSYGAFAQPENKGNIELNQFFGVHFPDDYATLRPDSSFMMGLRLGYWFANEASFEFSGQRAFSEDTTGGNVNLDGYRGNVLYHFNTKNTLQPFITVGGGLERSSSRLGKGHDWGMNGGAGLRFFFAEKEGIRLDMRYTTAKVTAGAASSTWQQNIETNVGFFILFGK